MRVRSLVLGVCCALKASSVVAYDPSALKCPVDSVKVGTACVDKYEASVWQVDPSNVALVKRIQKGRVTLTDLTAAGAVQVGCTTPPFNHPAVPANFPDSGQWTPIPGSNPPSPGVYAVSVGGVLPSACLGWFQASQACALSGKRLITNREWQDAAAGTPDPGLADNGTTTCATNSAGPANTGVRTSCLSNWGAYDMVGNVWEWAGDWEDHASPSGCSTDWTTQTGIPGADLSCFGGDGTAGVYQIPGSLSRGGRWDSGTDAGVFAVGGGSDPNVLSGSHGFRCSR